MDDLTGDPMTLGWLPHKPETWQYRFASLKKPLDMSHYTGRWEGNEPQFIIVSCPAGTRVKIMMVSRFGDIGITDDLNAEYGYGARVFLDELCEYSNNPTKE